MRPSRVSSPPSPRLLRSCGFECSAPSESSAVAKLDPMDASKLRGWRAHRQGLMGELAGRSAADALSSAGWARSIGGVNPYLTLFARAGTSRAEADKAAG